MKETIDLSLDLFRSNLKKIRGAEGITGAELCKKAGLKHQKRIHDIEEGKGKPTLGEVISLCTVLDVSMDDMLNQSVNIQIDWQ